MRVLLTTDTIGGVWTFTCELSRGLLEAGHVVALVSFGRAPDRAQSATMRALSQTFEDFLYTPSEVPLEWMEQNRRVSSEGFKILAQILHDFEPDVLHSSQFCFGSFGSSLPVAITAHSDVLTWAEATLAEGGGIEELERTSSPEWLSTYRALVTTGLEHTTEVAAPTSWMAHELAHTYGLARTPHVIPNGVSPIELQPLNRMLQAVTAGRLWDRAKGLAILSELEPPFPIHVAGEQLSNLQSSTIDQPGTLAHEDLLKLFAESAIYIATSVYEPFGLAPLEAAQCGCALVLRDIPTFREIWGAAGLYFRTADSLQTLLRSLAANPARLRGAQCRARCRAALYTTDAMTRQYLALYKQLLASATGIQEPQHAHA